MALTLTKVVLCCALAGGAAVYVAKRPAPPSFGAASPGPFLTLPKVDGLGPGQVMVIVPPECNVDERLKADMLTQDLQRKGLSVVRAETFHITANSREEVDEGRKQVEALVRGPRPWVIVGNRAKGNPSWDEVERELERARF